MELVTQNIGWKLQMFDEREKGEIVQAHLPCELCGSSDAKAVYSTGTAFCFSCKTWTREDGDPQQQGQRRRHLGLLQGDIRTLEKRGIREETCRKFGYFISKYQNKEHPSPETVQVAPYFWKGTQVAQHIRFANKDFPWLGEAKKVELFGQHLWRNSGKRLVITEGEIDAMTIAQVFNLRWPVISLPSGVNSGKQHLQRNLEFIESFDEIVLAFDSDQPGREAAKECAMLFTPGKVKIVEWSPFKDANEMLQAGKGADIAGKIFDARAFRPDGIVSGQDLWEVIKKPPVPGYDISIPQFNNMIKGLRKGELIMFTAGSGIGKSTLVNELAYELMNNHKQTLGIVALEENNKRSAERYMSIYLNKPLHLNREGVTEEKLREAFEATVGSGRMFFYDHFGSLESQNLMAKLRYMVKGLGVEWIILDHISIVVSGLEESGQDERKDIDRLMTHLRSLAEETNVGILAVVHLKRKDQGKSFNEGRQVSLSDLRGSGSLEQLSDGVVALERDQQGDTPNRSMIRVLKNRHVGITGPADYLDYHIETGRLLVAEEVQPEEFNEEEVPF